MNFDQLNTLPSSRVKALFGFVPAIQASALFRVLPELERRRATRLKERKNRKRLYVDNDGYPREVTPLEKVLMTLLYLRHNVRHEVVGAMFGYRADTSENTFHDVVPTARASCSHQPSGKRKRSGNAVRLSGRPMMLTS